MATDRALELPGTDVRMFWWVFAVRGGLAVVFAIVLFLASSFLGIFFFDPVTLVYMSLLLGSYVLGNGLLLGVAAGFGFEHHLHLWWLALGESCFALLLSVYIGISMIMTPESLAFLAGIHALGTGFFQWMLAVKTRQARPIQLLLAFAGVVSVALGVVFLQHIHQAPRTTTQVLSGYELFCGMSSIVFALRLRS